MPGAKCWKPSGNHSWNPWKLIVWHPQTVPLPAVFTKKHIDHTSQENLLPFIQRNLVDVGEWVEITVQEAFQIAKDLP